MDDLARGAWLGLPSLAGVTLGAFVYGPLGSEGWILIALAATLGGLALLVGFLAMRGSPRSARIALEGSLLVAMAIVAVVTVVTLFITARLNASFAGSNAEPAKLIVAALATWFGLVLTKELSEGKGALSVASLFKKSIQRAFKKPPPERGMLGFDAVWLERVHDQAEGWGMKARGVRARILADSELSTTRTD